MENSKYLNKLKAVCVYNSSEKWTFFTHEILIHKQNVTEPFPPWLCAFLKQSKQTLKLWKLVFLLLK